MVISPGYLLACGIKNTRILLQIKFADCTGASAGKEKPLQVNSDCRARTIYRAPDSVNQRSLKTRHSTEKCGWWIAPNLFPGCLTSADIWNGRMIKELPRISHTIGAQREAPGRTGEPNISAPDSAYAVQAAISRLAPVSHARSRLLVPPGDLLVMSTEHGNTLGCLPKLSRERWRRWGAPNRWPGRSSVPIPD